MEDGRPLNTIKLSFCKYLTVVDFDNAPPRIFLGRGGAFPAAAISARVNLLLAQQQGGRGGGQYQQLIFWSLEGVSVRALSELCLICVTPPKVLLSIHFDVNPELCVGARRKTL